MKQLNKSVAIILICAMMLMLAACEQTKTYATVEEWYADNPPLPEDFTHAVIKEEGLSATMDIFFEGNVMICKGTMSKTIFGEDEKMDEIYFKVLDNVIYKSQTKISDIISTLSVRSGIDASQISVRYEFYNPGATTPSYSKSIKRY